MLAGIRDVLNHHHTLYLQSFRQLLRDERWGISPFLRVANRAWRLGAGHLIGAEFVGDATRRSPRYNGLLRP